MLHGGEQALGDVQIFGRKAVGQIAVERVVAAVRQVDFQAACRFVGLKGSLKAKCVAPCKQESCTIFVILYKNNLLLDFPRIPACAGMTMAG